MNYVRNQDNLEDLNGSLRLSTQKRALSFFNIFFKLQVIKVVNNERLIFCVITEIKHDAGENG